MMSISSFTTSTVPSTVRVKPRQTPAQVLVHHTRDRGCRRAVPRQSSVFCVASEVDSNPWSSAALTVGASALLLLTPVGPSEAARISTEISDVTYAERPCDKGEKLIGQQGSASCLLFSGTVTNPDKKNGINNADVFGRIYDKAGNGVTDIEENNRIAYVDYIPPGTSQVEFKLTVSTQQLGLGKLSWKGLKVAGFTGQVLPGQAGQLGLKAELDCDAIGPDSDPFDVEECENAAAMSLIR